MVTLPLKATSGAAVVLVNETIPGNVTVAVALPIVIAVIPVAVPSSRDVARAPDPATESRPAAFVSIPAPTWRTCAVPTRVETPDWRVIAERAAMLVHLGIEDGWVDGFSV
jgi:hypothetical protein